MKGTHLKGKITTLFKWFLFIYTWVTWRKHEHEETKGKCNEISKVPNGMILSRGSTLEGLQMSVSSLSLCPTFCQTALQEWHFRKKTEWWWSVCFSWRQSDFLYFPVRNCYFLALCAAGALTFKRFSICNFKRNKILRKLSKKCHKTVERNRDGWG